MRDRLLLLPDGWWSPAGTDDAETARRSTPRKRSRTSRKTMGGKKDAGEEGLHRRRIGKLVEKLGRRRLGGDGGPE